PRRRGGRVHPVSLEVELVAALRVSERRLLLLLLLIGSSALLELLDLLLTTLVVELPARLDLVVLGPVLLRREGVDLLLHLPLGLLLAGLRPGEHDDRPTLLDLAVRLPGELLDRGAPRDPLERARDARLHAGLNDDVPPDAAADLVHDVAEIGLLD